MSRTSGNGTGLALPPSTVGPRGSGGRMDTALARREDLAPGIDWDEIKRVAGAAIKAGILPRSITREDQAVAIALKARELGVPPMQGFSTIHLIQGVASCSSNLMLGLAYKHLPEFSLKVLERTATKCRLAFRRDARREWVEIAYTIEEAKAAGLTSKDNWRNHPAAMLTARVIGIGCRLVAPDVFAGLYTSEELAGGFVPDDTVPVREVSIDEVATSVPPPTPAEVAPPADATSSAAIPKDVVVAAWTRLRDACVRYGVNASAPTPSAAALKTIKDAVGFSAAAPLKDLDAGRLSAADTTALLDAILKTEKAVLDKHEPVPPADAAAPPPAPGADDDIPF